MRPSLLTIAIALIAAAAPLLAEAAPPEPTNIIFVLADDLGYGDLSCYGQKHFDTPALDRMASEGLRFTQHYAGSTVCAPSRACLLAGQHTGHVFQRANGKQGFREDPADPCVAAWLRTEGYATAMIGKSGLSGNSRDGAFPNRKGFDHFFGYVSHGAAHRYFPKELWRNGDPIRYPGNRGKEGDTYSGDLFLDDALDWIERHAERPFFLHLPLQQPHLDLAVPDAYRDPFLGKWDETPLGSATSHYRREEHPRATFAGMIAHLDDSVGAVLAKVRELGIEGRTLVLFASDNGAVTAAGWSSDNFDSSGPLRGHKRDLYEGGIRVPLIAWQPGAIEPGGVTDHVSAFWDFPATACEIAGASVPVATDGLSFAPTLYGRDGQQDHEFLYWEFYEQGGKQAVRWGDWKGVRLNAVRKPGGPIELYNLAEDLGETRNVAAEHPQVVARIKAFMAEAHVPAGAYRLAGSQ